MELAFTQLLDELQNNWYRSAENAMSLQEVPLMHDIKKGVWCTLCADRIIRPFFLSSLSLSLSLSL